MTSTVTYDELEGRNAQLKQDAHRHGQEIARLEQQNAEWSDIFRDLTDPIMIVDTQHQVTRINQAMVDVLNRSQEDVLGKKYWLVLYGGEGPIDDCPLVLAEKTLRRQEKQISDDQLGGTFLLSVSLVTQQSGKLRGYALTLKDITSLKREYRKREAAEKYKVIHDLSGGVANAFNNLLTAIQGTTSLVLEEVGKNEPFHEKLLRVEDYIDKGRALTKQLLSFGDGDTYERVSTDLNDIVGKTWDRFFKNKKNIQYHQAFEKKLWPCDVDPGQIEQVIRHLYTNACEAMPQGGEIRAETENVVFDENYADFFGIPAGKYIKFSVTDTGEGMDYAMQEKVFDPFFSTRSNHTGLGLAFAQRMVNNHSGIIHVYSEKGRGANFNVYLPASSHQVQSETETDMDDVVFGTETVLLVDDQKMVLEVGADMLKAMGYKVLVACSGQEAVELYSSGIDHIELVILDMIMPDMDGRQTYDQLREMNPQVKVLLASGYSMTNQVNEILECGFNGFIQKPFNMPRLSKKIRTILGDAG